MSVCSPGPACRTCADFEKCFSRSAGEPIAEKIKSDYLLMCAAVDKKPTCYIESK